VWPLLLLKLAVPLAVIAEGIFLALYLWWAAGGGPPRGTQAVRATAFRRCTLSRRQWSWGIIAALFFAATIHSSIALLFRLVSFPMAAFRHGYDFSFIPSLPLKWLAVVVSAISAAICEETGFRGYMQRPIEQRHGAPIAILISSLFFLALHLTKAWATLGMIPIGVWRRRTAQCHLLKGLCRGPTMRALTLPAQFQQLARTVHLRFA
jgi:membrane protease YdiL (CAAX protease family)